MNGVGDGSLDTTDGDLAVRNRRVLRILLAIMVTLAVAGLLVGIRW